MYLFLLEKNETLGLVGESGCGKSTLARLLLKLISLDSGTVAIEGRDVSAVKGQGAEKVAAIYAANLSGFSCGI